MNLASKLIIGYIGYSSIHRNKKNKTKTFDNYDDKINNIINKYSKDDISKINEKKYKIDKLEVHRKIKDKKECEVMFQKYLKKNNINKVIHKKLFIHQINKQQIQINQSINYLYNKFELKNDKIYNLKIEFEISNIYKLSFIFISNNKHMIIPFKHIFNKNCISFIIQYIQQIEELELYIIFPNQINNNYIYNYSLKIEEILPTIHCPIIIYKNNNMENQIFYEDNYLFIKNYDLIRQPNH